LEKTMKLWHICFLLAFGGTACAGTAPQTFHRDYAPGESYRYKMVRTYEENGAFKREEIAESLHEVPEEGPPRERISFTSLTKRTAEGTEDLSAAIAKFPAYETSVSATSNPELSALPDLKGWDMGVVGPVTDLHTFLIAVSHQVGADKISEPGQTYTTGEAAKASWANGENIPVGEDCIQISITLLESTDDRATYETRFMPPTEACLTPLKPWMEAPVVEGTPNNFQQQMMMGPMAAAMWGREQFVITSTIRRSDGRILSATMDNPLTLMLKVGCDPNLDSCKHELPMAIHRKLKLELLP
jgi:hypothetical protein